MPNAYTEDQLVEQPAIGLFAELGWSTVSALDETFGVTGTLSRETKGDVVLVSRLRAALERLNSALPAEAISAAISGTIPVAAAVEVAVFTENGAVAWPGMLFEWLTANLCKYLMVKTFLFE